MNLSIISKLLDETLLLNIAKTQLVEDWSVSDERLVENLSKVILDSYKAHLEATEEAPSLDGYKRFLYLLDIEALIRDVEIENAVKACETLFSDIVSELKAIKQAVISEKDTKTIITMIDKCLNKINSK